MLVEMGLIESQEAWRSGVDDSLRAARKDRSTPNIAANWIPLETPYTPETPTPMAFQKRRRPRRFRRRKRPST